MKRSAAVVMAALALLAGCAQAETPSLPERADAPATTPAITESAPRPTAAPTWVTIPKPTGLQAEWATVRVAAERKGGYSRPSGSHGGSCPGQHVDHVVALTEAHESGLSAGDLRRFNTYSGNHRCLPAEVNTSKGSSEPHQWLAKPKAGTWFRQNPAAFCEFVAIWVAAKAQWQMTADRSEHDAVRSLLASDCADASSPSLRGTSSLPAAAEPSSSRRTDEPEQAGGCTHWHAGNPKHTHPGTNHDGSHTSGKCAGY